MILRPRQKIFVENCVQSLRNHGAALGVAPTGAGKTVMLSSVASHYKRPLILQHRDELVAQNRATFQKINPEMRSDLFVAGRKAWSPGATFAMVQTLVNSVESIPEGMDLLAIDECHHVRAASYRKVIDTFLERNPGGHVLGVTATPQRTDRKALIEVFPVVADVIQLGELVQGGFLVKPRGFAIDLGIKDKIDRIPRTSDFDMDEVERVMDHRPLNEHAVREWKKEAHDRQTVVFCSTVNHATHLCEVFIEHGIRAITVHGKMGARERKETLDAFDSGKYQVILNCMVLTEGWDCQPVSCVMLMRPCSAKGPMLQMVGRGLRKLDQSRYPGQTKSDCKILDFGYSLVTHGDLETIVNLVPKTKDGEGEAAMKVCPGCGAEIPARTMECPICEYEFPSKEKQNAFLEEIQLTEIQLLDASPFRWESFFDGLVQMANGVTAWAAVIEFSGLFWSVCGKDKENPRIVDRTADKITAFASSDDFLRQNGDTSLCRKSRSWLSLPPTEKQIQSLPGINVFNTNRYAASCMLTWKWNERKIKSLITSAK